MKAQNRRRFNGLLMATWAGLAARSQAQSPAAAPANWDQVVAAAKKEGQLVFYTGALTPKILAPIINDYEARYGIKVEILNGRPSQIRERIRAEQAAGRVLADLNMDGPTLNQPATIGSYVAHEGFPNAGKIVGPFVDDGIVVPVAFGRQSVMINTRLVKPADEPKSWQDLLDPKWKGRILSDDPRSPGSGSVVYDVLHEKFGAQYVQKLVAQNLTISTDISLNERRLAQGEFALFLPGRVGSINNLRGLPIRFMNPAEGYIYVILALAKVKNAPHPNAARLFMNHFLDSPAQKHVLDAAYGSVTGESFAHLPEDLQAIGKGKLLGASEPKGQDERRKVYSAYFGK